MWGVRGLSVGPPHARASVSSGWFRTVLHVLRVMPALDQLEQMLHMACISKLAGAVTEGAVSGMWVLGEVHSPDPSHGAGPPYSSSQQTSPTPLLQPARPDEFDIPAVREQLKNHMVAFSLAGGE